MSTNFLLKIPLNQASVELGLNKISPEDNNSVVRFVLAKQEDYYRIIEALYDWLIQTQFNPITQNSSPSPKNSSPSPKNSPTKILSQDITPTKPPSKRAQRHQSRQQPPQLNKRNVSSINDLTSSSSKKLKTEHTNPQKISNELDSQEKPSPKYNLSKTDNSIRIETPNSNIVFEKSIRQKKTIFISNWNGNLVQYSSDKNSMIKNYGKIHQKRI